VVYDFFEKIKDTDLFSWMKYFQTGEDKQVAAAEGSKDGDQLKYLKPTEI